MTFKACSKCGANNNAGSKHIPFQRYGKHWCGHCGTKLENQRVLSMDKQTIQTLITKLDTNAISLKEAKEFAQKFGMRTTARTKNQFVKDLCNGGQTMSYADAKAAKLRLEEHHKATSDELRKFDKHKGAMGLTPDHIKATDEWKRAKANYDAATEALRKYNQRFFKLYDKEVKAERREKQTRLMAGENLINEG